MSVDVSAIPRTWGFPMPKTFFIGPYLELLVARYQTKLVAKLVFLRNAECEGYVVMQMANGPLFFALLRKVGIVAGNRF